MLRRYALLCLFPIALSCKKGDNNNGGNNSTAEKGYVSGTVTDTQGKPLAGVKVLIDNTIIYNSHYQTVTDANGKYKVKISTGSWMPYAQLTKTYNGKTYTLYLHPDNEAGFDLNGGVCNFQWKLTGKRQETLHGTYYGGTISVNSGIGSDPTIDPKNIVYTLTPVGPLIDGSTGSVLKVKVDPNYHYEIKDVPIGKFKVKAYYNDDLSKPIKLRNRFTNRNGSFENEITVEFEPEIPGLGEKMADIEYYY
jgi:hypothetical protein